MPHEHAHGDIKKLRAAFWINLVFTLIELVGGLWVNSIAIISDAIHDLGDSFSLGGSWYLEKYSRKGPSRQYSYGYRRFSLLAALINALVLVGGSVWIVLESVQRLQNPPKVDGEGMMLMALGGLLFNGLAYWKLHGGASHQTRVLSLHLLEDVLGWLAALIGGLLIRWLGWHMLDPLLSLGIAVFILFNALKSLGPTFRVLLQAIPSNHKPEYFRALLLREDVVKAVHDLHVWTLDGQYHVLTAHLLVDPNHSLQTLASAKSRMKEALQQAGVPHSTLEFDTPEEAERHVHCQVDTGTPAARSAPG